MLFDRVGIGADERDLNGDERIVTDCGHGPQLAGYSRLGLAICLASLIGNRRKWGRAERRARASDGRDSSSPAAEPAVARLPKAEGSWDRTYSVVLRLLAEPGEQRVPAVAN